MAINKSTRTSAEMVEGAVTFLDVLGWKGIWTRTPGSTGAIRRLLDLLEEAESVRSRVEVFGKVSTSQRGISTRIECISDTIVLLTQGGVNDTIRIHGEICKRLIAESISKEIPLRGATCYGKYQISSERNILVGPAVDEAAAWHQNTRWIGVILTPSALFNYSLKQSVWAEYSNVPFKSNPIKHSKSVNWCEEWNKITPIATGDPLKQIQEKFSRMGPLTPEIGQIYSETIEFYNTMMKPIVTSKRKKAT